VSRSGSKQVKTLASGLPARTFKVVVIGDMSVGKTCLLCRLCGGRFPEHTETTIGVDFLERSLEVEGETVKLQLWDTAGQERFRHSMVPHYYRNVDAVVFVFDVTRRTSFDNIPRWIDELHSYSGRSKTIPQIIIGNKCDLHADRQVRTSEIKGLASHHGLPYWETSAKSDLERDTVEVIFKNIAESLQLKTPLMGFPPQHSSAINLHSKSGLSIGQSIAASSTSTSQSMSGSDGSRYVTKPKRNTCCGG